MAPTIERVMLQSRIVALKIEGKEDLPIFKPLLKEEGAEREEAILLESNHLNKEKGYIVIYIEHIFALADEHPLKGKSSYEKSAIIFAEMLKRNKEDESSEDFFTLAAFKLPEEKDDEISFYLGFVCDFKDFERVYPNLCDEHVCDWNEIKDLEEWDPRYGEIQKISERIFVPEYGKAFSQGLIILAVPFSSESPIAMAVKEIRDNYTYLN